MQYTSHELFVGAIEGVPNCTTETQELEIWPKFMLMVLLQGAQHFAIDGTHFHIGAGSGETEPPVVFMLNVARDSRLRFFNESEMPLNKVMISAPLPWLKRLFDTRDVEQRSVLQDFFSAHLAHFSFEPGKHILQLAKKIMSPPPALKGELRSLYLRAQAHDMMWQSLLAMLAERKEKALPAPALMSLRQCERVREFIVANLDKDLTTDLIAREVGSSASTLQRHFKAQFGITVFDFIRQERLDAARVALTSGGIPISHAAHMAGYNSISSFTTAFRRAYGVTPGQVRV
ncbi:helix-turn-helix transcriptional regulator [Nitratireductor aquimarinus]|nr:helix-turn-helix transcriptional regulator [Nitratireductor pacificus]MBN7788765.1 helix-turn-helix transcriptional regulator [Nitratireductor aquimarinus]MBN7779958.1 helix-turn-helix transcriptional regulator [Nitratireductor pacificus]MBN8242562.1 helix-turn-helix transcriptional regulator [Nitratireductor aquimarinus]MBY6097484.1 AraC family transcriptional regulator [Nitratireductor aquimarinus]